MAIGLIRLSGSGLQLYDPGEDIRGKEVYDRVGQKIGKISDLLVEKLDLEELRSLSEPSVKVRYAEVDTGGFIGIGKRQILLPVQRLTRNNGHLRVKEARYELLGP